MRKVTCILICIFLLGMVIPGAYAAGSAQMRVSASTTQVYRGDTVTFTVSISSVENCKAAGFAVSYDSSVFEWVSGSVLAGGTAMSDFSGGTGSFAFSEGKNISGGIFSFKLRVKDTAPFGGTTVSGQGNARDTEGTVSCSVSGTGITVACSHDFGNASKIDGENHQSTCSVCGEKKTESHSWDSGKEIKPATCKETGSKTLTCTDCGATKTETIPLSTQHKYGAYTKVDENKHSHTCSVCGKKETVNHTWNSGKVTKKATCQEEGSKELTCTGCKTTKTEVVNKTAHSFTPWEKVDDGSHFRKCTVCDKEETGEHSYDDGWSHDENGHFQECECGHITNWQAHVPGPEPTETTDQFCTVCSRLLKPNTAHEHVFDGVWTQDQVGHWHKCTQCDQKDSFSTHVYESECDEDCNICGCARTAPHFAEEVRVADESGHWYPCKHCGAKVGFTAHTPGSAATTSTPQNCTVCDYEMAPVLPHDHVYDSKGSAHVHACACGEEYSADALSCAVCLAENKPFPWWIVCIGEAVVFGGIMVFFLVNNRKKREDDSRPEAK